MRTPSAQDLRIFAAKGQSTWLRVDVKDAGGTYRRLDQLYGYDFIDSATLHENPDDPCASLELNLKREIFKLALSTEVASSRINTLGTGTRLLELFARVQAYVQLTPAGVKPSSANWTLIFDGEITRTDSGRDPMTVECADLANQLKRRWIENERAYGIWQPGQRYIGDVAMGAVVTPQPEDRTYPNNSQDSQSGPWFKAIVTGTAAADSWVGSHSYTDATVTPTVPNGYVYRMTGTATSGSTEPAWPTTPGGTIVDGGVTWGRVTPTPPVWPNTLGATVADNGITWMCVAVAGGSPTGTPLETQIQMLLDDTLGPGAWALNIGAVPFASITAWTGGTSQPHGTIVTGAVAGATYYFQNQGGVFTSGGSTPAWTSSLGGVVPDGGGTWTNVGQAPGFVVRPFTQSGESLLTALQTLADLIGWSMRYRWDNTSGQFRLNLYDPARTSTSIAQTIGPNKYRAIEQFERDGDGIRNKIEVRYYDQSVSSDPNSNAPPMSVVVSNAESVASYGPLYAAVAEGQGAQINTSAEATTMANAILSDLAQPPINTQMQTELFWWPQLTDVLALSKDNLHFDSDLVAAVNSIQHDFKQGGDSTTTLGLRQKPSSGHARWFNKLVAGGRNGGPIKRVAPLAPRDIEVTPTLAGARVSYSMPSSKTFRYDFTELHGSLDSHFVPDSSTLLDCGRSGVFLLSGLVPGSTYYIRLRHVDVRGNAGALSSLQSFVAGSLGTGSPALGLGFHVEQTGTTKTLVGADLPFQVASQGSSLWLSNKRLSLPYACVMRLHARMTFESGDDPVEVGARAQLYVVDAAGHVVTAGPLAQGTSDGANGVALVAELNDQVSLFAGSVTTYRLRYWAQRADGSTVVGNWNSKAQSTSGFPLEWGCLFSGHEVPISA